MGSSHDGMICKLCQAKFYTLEQYKKVAAEMVEIDKNNEALCAELYEI